ncbi:MAG: hypothetical protein B6242_02830, partial [Anaerolineaceae bacterium 4572_78]
MKHSKLYILKKYLNIPFQILKLIALTSVLCVVVGSFVNLTARPTILPPATQTLQPATVLISTMPTYTSTDTATHTATRPTSTRFPTYTSTSTSTNTPTNTLTPTATITPTTMTPSQTDTPTETSTPVQTLTPLPTPTVTPTHFPDVAVFFLKNISQTHAITLEVGTQSLVQPTPAPVLRAVLADNVPDYTQANDHFWFERPYDIPHVRWGSWYYPYGTNNNGDYLWHKGIDIQNPMDTPVIAVGNGKIIFADRDSIQVLGPYGNFYGRAVVIQHTNTWKGQTIYSLYGHVSKVLVKEGDTIETGQIIALTGQAGVALGPHLHLEVRIGENIYSNTQNPDLWVLPDPGHGMIAGRVVDRDNYFVPQQLITLHHTPSKKFWRQTRTYPDKGYKLDPELGETFTFADVPVGNYIIRTKLDGVAYEMPVAVQNRKVSFVLIDGRKLPPDKITPSPTP